MIRMAVINHWHMALQPCVPMLGTMKMQHALAPLLLAALTACASLSPAPSPATGPAVEPDTVVLLSIDGLNLDALGRGNSPHIDALAAAGVQARWMTPSYPAITFPNHYSIVTGLLPDRHGIIHNQMDDPDLGRFELRDRDALRNPGWWSDALPIWLQARRAGLRTATFSYPGGEVAIDGQHADLWHHYDESLSPSQRIARMLDWLALPQRPHLLAGYFEHVDKAGHYAGPNSEAYAQALRQIDTAVGELVAGLRQRGQLDRINLIIVSDHGMAEVPNGQVVAVEDMVDPSVARAVSVGQVIGFDPLPGQQAEAHRQLVGAHTRYDCWPRGELPARWQYGSHRRIPAIICQMHEGWDANHRHILARRAPGVRGSHGYDIDLPSMRSPFIAHGPAFRRQAVIEPIANVDVYPLMTGLLGLSLPPNDGNPAATADALAR